MVPGLLMKAAKPSVLASQRRTSLDLTYQMLKTAPDFLPRCHDLYDKPITNSHTASIGTDCRHLDDGSVGSACRESEDAINHKLLHVLIQGSPPTTTDIGVSCTAAQAMV